MYTVRRCTLKDDKFYGPIHLSVDGYVTLCGQTIDEKFHILTSDGKGIGDCKKCLKEQNKDV